MATATDDEVDIDAETEAERKRREEAAHIAELDAEDSDTLDTPATEAATTPRGKKRTPNYVLTPVEVPKEAPAPSPEAPAPLPEAPLEIPTPTPESPLSAVTQTDPETGTPYVVDRDTGLKIPHAELATPAEKEAFKPSDVTLPERQVEGVAPAPRVERGERVLETPRPTPESALPEIPKAPLVDPDPDAQYFDVQPPEVRRGAIVGTTPKAAPITPPEAPAQPTQPPAPKPRSSEFGLTPDEYKAAREGTIPQAPATTTTTAVSGADTSGKDNTGVADYFRKRGDDPITDGNDPRLTQININGQKWTVHKEAAPYFDGFLKELANQGAPLRSDGGWNYRQKVGARGLSEHSWAGAIDVNQEGRDEVSPDMLRWLQTHPGALKTAEQRWHIYGGERFGDLGHFEWGGVGGEPSQVTAAADDKNYVTGRATTFGYKDQGDPGVGAPRLGKLATNNKDLIGLAVPEEALRSYISAHPADWRKARVEVVTENGRSIMVPIVDLGPHDTSDQRGVVADFTQGLTNMLGNTGEQNYKFRIIANAGPDVMKNPQAFADEQAAIREGLVKAPPLHGQGKKKLGNYVLTPIDQGTPAMKAAQDQANQFAQASQTDTLDELNRTTENPGQFWKSIQQPITGVSEPMRKAYADNFKEEFTKYAQNYYGEKDPEKAFARGVGDANIGTFTQNFWNAALGTLGEADVGLNKAAKDIDFNRLDQFARTLHPESDGAGRAAFIKTITSIPDPTTRSQAIGKLLATLEPAKQGAFDVVGLADSADRVADPKYQAWQTGEIAKKDAFVKRLFEADPTIRGTPGEWWSGQAGALMTNTALAFLAPALRTNAFAAQIYGTSRDRIQSEHPEWTETQVSAEAGKSTFAQLAPQEALMAASHGVLGPILRWGSNPIVRFGIGGGVHLATGAAGGALMQAGANVAEGKPIEEGTGEAAIAGVVQAAPFAIHGGVESVIHPPVRPAPIVATTIPEMRSADQVPPPPPVVESRGPRTSTLEAQQAQTQEAVPPAPPVPPVVHEAATMAPETMSDQNIEHRNIPTDNPEAGMTEEEAHAFLDNVSHDIERRHQARASDMGLAPSDDHPQATVHSDLGDQGAPVPTVETEARPTVSEAPREPVPVDEGHPGDLESAIKAEKTKAQLAKERLKSYRGETDEDLASSAAMGDRVADRVLKERYPKKYPKSVQDILGAQSAEEAVRIAHQQEMAGKVAAPEGQEHLLQAIVRTGGLPTPVKMKSLAAKGETMTGEMARVHDAWRALSIDAKKRLARDGVTYNKLFRNDALPLDEFRGNLEQHPDGFNYGHVGDMLAQVEHALTQAEQGKRVYGSGPEGRMSVRGGPRGKGLSRDQARAVADEISRQLPNAPRITVVESRNELPAGLREQVQAAAGHANVEAIAHGNDIYAIASENHSAEGLTKALLEEAIGHYGVENVLGDKFNGLVDLVNRTMAGRPEYEALKKLYGNDPRTLAAEYIAKLARGEIRDPSMWDRIKLWFNQLARALGFHEPFTEAELRSALSRSKEALAKGNDRMSAPVPRLSMAAHPPGEFNLERQQVRAARKRKPAIQRGKPMEFRFPEPEGFRLEQEMTGGAPAPREEQKTDTELGQQGFNFSLRKHQAEQELGAEAESQNMRPLGYRAAVRLDNGEIFRGPDHGAAAENAYQNGSIRMTDKNTTFGFVDSKGKFVTMDEADRILHESRQPKARFSLREAGPAEGGATKEEKKLIVRKPAKGEMKGASWIRSAYDSLSRNPHTAPLAVGVMHWVDRAHEVRAGLDKPIRKAFRGIKKKELRQALEDFGKIQDTRDSKQPVPEGLHADAYKILEGVKKSAKMSERLAIQNKILVHDPRLIVGNDKGGYRPFRAVSDYVPRNVKREIIDIMRMRHLPDPFAINREASRAKNLGKWNDLVHEFINKGYATSEGEVLDHIKGAANLDTKHVDKKLGNLEKARVSRLPSNMYEYSLTGMLDYNHRISDRMAEIEAFGQRGEMFQKAIDRIEASPIAGTDKAKGMINYIQHLRNHILGLNEITPLGKTMGVLRSFATGMDLSGWMGMLQDTIGSSLQTPTHLGIWNTAKGFYHGLTHLKKMAHEAEDLGIIHDDMGRAVKEIDHDYQSGSLSDRMARLGSAVAEKGLMVSGRTASEKFIRTLTLSAAKTALRDMVTTVRANPESRKARAWIHYMHRRGADVSKLVAENGAGGESSETNRFLRRTVADIQAGYDLIQRSPLQETTSGKFFGQYLSWATNQTRNVMREIMLPMFRPNQKTVTVEVNGREYTVKDSRFVAVQRGLMLMAAGAATSLVNDQNREFFLGRINSYRDLKQLAADIASNPDKTDSFMHLIWSGYNAMLNGGMLGSVGNILQYFQDPLDRNRFKDPMHPTTFSKLDSLIGFVMRSAQEGQYNSHEADQLMRNWFGVYREGKPVIARALSTLGYTPNWIKEERTRESVAALRNTLKRFNDEEHLGIKPPPLIVGGPAANRNTPIAQSITDALYRGDSVSALKIQTDYLDTAPDAATRFKMAKSLDASIRAQTPLRLGSTSNKDFQAAFWEWARKSGNVTRARLDDFQHLVNVYNRTAYDAGFGKKLLQVEDEGGPVQVQRRSQTPIKEYLKQKIKEEQDKKELQTP